MDRKSPAAASAPAESGSPSATRPSAAANQATRASSRAENTANSRDTIDLQAAKDKPRANTAPTQWCATIQSSAAGSYKGTRLQFSAYLSSQSALGGGALWLRADDAKGLTAAFENQLLYPLTGNSPWTFEVIVIDVPETARALFYGAVFRNGGSFWMDSAEFNVVDKAVPLTGRPVTAPGAAVNTHLDLTALRAAPVNLDFEQTEPLQK